MLPIALGMLAVVVPAHATGAYCTMFCIDLGRAPADYEGRVFLQQDVEGYGVNQYVAIMSHPSQWWFEVYAVFFDAVLDDISDAYVSSRSGKRHYFFIEYVSMVLLMLTLMPLLKTCRLPWHEVMMQGNNYEGESGVTVTIRHWLHSMVWWTRRGPEHSIYGGHGLYRSFKNLTLPKLTLAEGGWNYGAWKPYWQVSGPNLFSYSPPRGWTIKKSFDRMLVEETYKAMYEGRPAPSMRVYRQIVRIYGREYVQGPYVSLATRRAFNAAAAIRVASRNADDERSRM
jgi:hypothetical protein